MIRCAFIPRKSTPTVNPENGQKSAGYIANENPSFDEQYQENSNAGARCWTNSPPLIQHRADSSPVLGSAERVAALIDHDVIRLGESPRLLLHIPGITTLELAILQHEGLPHAETAILLLKATRGFDAAHYASIQAEHWRGSAGATPWPPTITNAGKRHERSYEGKTDVPDGLGV